MNLNTGYQFYDFRFGNTDQGFLYTTKGGMDIMM
jgi:hypothetical protein